MPAEDTDTRAWQIYGQRQLARAFTPPIPDRLGWTPWEGIGPGAEVLGDITGRRILDIGSGAGHHAVHLAHAHGARVTGIELSPTRHERAVSTHADIGGVEFVRGDVAEYLAGAQPFDAPYAIGTLAFIDPHRSLPALRDRPPPERQVCDHRRNRSGCVRSVGTGQSRRRRPSIEDGRILTRPFRDSDRP
ncbi:methyltransferase domain-containing protein [Streptomyces sp. NBC_01198]|uniref:methyltransferase domain-containing protein n=1 Tax=Streptomyces sp. NBC_01198 TaxID=2903769 RepID=UPI002E135E42|nr:methyltransferase domain-containing protein [Streptomyces sp. NBC_01198]